MPGLAARAGRRGKALANLVSTRKATEIAGARNGTGDKETHRLLRRLCRENSGRAEHSDGDCRNNNSTVHDVPSSGERRPYLWLNKRRRPHGLKRSVRAAFSSLLQFRNGRFWLPQR